jgi:anti-anti-sigma regulatory factor
MDGPMTESLSVEDDSFHSIPLIRIRGALVYGHHLAAVRDACTRLTGTAPKRVIIDLRAVPSIDSSGLSALLDIKNRFFRTPKCCCSARLIGCAPRSTRCAFQNSLR